MSQAFNSVGTTTRPIIGGWLIFALFTTKTAQGADSAKIPHLGFATVFMLLAVSFKFAHLPALTNNEEIGRGLDAMKYPHTALGMITIFM